MVILGDNYDSLFVMDVTEGYQGLNLLNINKNGDNLKAGSCYDIDINDHPAIKSAIDSGNSAYTFEWNNDFPNIANNYIGCKPIIINGKTRIIIGIAYNWSTLRDSLKSTILKTMLISISGMLIVMTIILLIVYRRAVDPVKRIQNAPRKDDGRSHVGMENTRTRLKEMCKGEIRIESTVGEGTTATIILPKKGQIDKDTVS